MKPVAVLLAMAVAAPSVARAQVPTQAPAPAPETPPAAGPAPAPETPPPETPPPPTPAATQGAAAPPGDQYYVEPRPKREPPPPPPFEPPVPGQTAFEPPPPPEARHIAPRMSLWLGARLGWFFPFGNVWADGPDSGTTDGQPYYTLEGKPWRDYASSGPMLELDVGMRLSRSYTVFALWERAQLGSGDDDSGRDGEQDGAESDFWGLGLRASSDPDRIGFLTEVAIGYRRARTFFTNGVEYQFTDAPFEARLGLGAEFRFSRTFTLSPLLTVGVGGFGSAEAVESNGNIRHITGPFDESDGHAWATVQVGGHFDLLPSAK
jgi:hypothetical protein